MSIHDNLDNFLTADLHGELSENERAVLHAHLVECTACRQAHQETKSMNKILEETLTQEKADPAFEQRMLAGFRNRIPERGGVMKSITNVMALRPVQITAVVALLLGLVQIGRMITGEGRATHYLAARLSDNESRDRVAVLRAKDKADFSAYRDDAETQAKPMVPAETLAQSAAPPAVPLGRPEFHEETQADARAAAKMAKTAPEDQSNATGSMSDEAEAIPAPSPLSAIQNRKLIRNARVDLEIVRFEDAVEKITAFATEEKGYVATTSSEKQANGKLKGEVVVKVLPETLDRFLQKVRGLGELKNQTLGTEDVTKAYFDTDSRLKNARVMEQRLIDMLKTKTGKVSDLLQVEKELGRVREEIEKMQGDLKYWDSQVQFATVTIALAEKDLEEPAAFLLKEHAQLSLYAPEVERIYNDIKGLASSHPGGMQITNAQLDRDYSGRVSARLSILIAPEESEAIIGRVKGLGRVENFQTQTERVAQGGEGMSENAKTKRDKVELSVTISREEQEQAFQQTSLQIRTSSVEEKTKELRGLTEKQNGRVRTSSFNRDPNGGELANVTLRVPLKNYSGLMQSLNSLGKVENVSVQRQDRADSQIDEANAPADISIRIYSQGNIVSPESGLWATLRNTLSQSAAAIMWSLRMIGVAIAFLAPWVIALLAIIWIAKRIVRSRKR